MTINKAEVITIPKWVLIVVLPIFLSSATGYVASKINAARTETRVELVTKEVEKKANQTEFLLIQSQMNRIEANQSRIETKLDAHMGSGKLPN